MTLDLAFLETPLVVPTEPSVPFDGSGEASLAAGDDTAPKVPILASATSAAPLDSFR